MHNIINENTVLNFYLKQMEEDNISFLVGKEKIKNDIREDIEKLLVLEDIHQQIQVAKSLWKVLFSASMSALNTDKRGYDRLFDYFDEYVNFEELIFASDSFYRDHTLHCLWVYFLGEYLYCQEQFKGTFKNIFAQSEHLVALSKVLKQEKYKAVFGWIADLLGRVVEVMNKSDSIRCLNALTHDLGYPLKKIKKINNSISNILPYFSINHFDEFNFTFSNEQRATIESFLDLMTLDVSYIFSGNGDVNARKFEQAFEFSDTGMLIGLKETVVDSYTEKEKQDFVKYLTPNVVLKKEASKYARFSEDFENYEHGIMSAFILFKTLAYSKNFKMNIGDMNNTEIKDLDEQAYMYTHLIYNAVSNHTSPSYRIKSISDPSAFLILIDEIEEFSRISRANQNRSYISEFCKSSIYMEEDVFCVDFIFDNKEIVNLDPERAFKGRCKKTLSLFDISDLDEDFKMRMRCVDQLYDNEKTYTIEFARKYVKVDIDGEEMNIPKYLKSREFYTREEYARL